jgi:hypothetical protein
MHLSSMTTVTPSSTPLATLVAVSDVHFGTLCFDQVMGKLINKNPSGDFLYFGGDASEPHRLNCGNVSVREGIKRALGALSEVGQFRKRFWVLGNNDLEDGVTGVHRDIKGRKSVLMQHTSEYAELAREFGFHLLDHAPFFDLQTGIGFAGNIGDSDGSIFSPLEESIYTYCLDNAPADYLSERLPTNDPHEARLIFELMKARLYAPVPDGFTMSAFFAYCFDRLQRDIQTLKTHESLKGIVLGTHTVPSSKLARNFDPNDLNAMHTFWLENYVVPTPPNHVKAAEPATRPHFNFKNLGLGSDRLGDHYQDPAVIGGFFGHTHPKEQQTIQLHGRNVHNVSGHYQPASFAVTQSGEGFELIRTD